MFICQKCKSKYVKQSGKCFNCNEWNTIVPDSPVIVVNDSAQKILNNKIKEFERVLVLHTKSVVLIGGEPGIGKSTLMCQLACNIDGKCLYLCGEEYSGTVKTRITRVNGKIPENLIVVDCVFFENVETLLGQHKPDCVILDSIHTMRTESNDSSKDILMDIIDLSRRYNFCCILISHITKDGIIAGPKTLEHMVDAVLYLEGDRYANTRCLKSIKNRFGPTGETGIFQMEANGLVEVSNPSVLFLSNRRASVAGSVIFPFYGGARTYLVEIQSLVVESQFFNVETVGVESKRVNMIIAILYRWCKVNFYKYNICINAVGGVKISDPAADLAIAAALLSSLWKKPVDSKICFFGELGLTGEIRAVQGEDARIFESKRMGFHTIYANFNKEAHASSAQVKKITDIDELTKILN